MLQGFNDDDLYLIDMSYLNSPAELVYDLTSVLENEQAKNKRIKIKIGGIDLNQAQLMSIKSLILSVNSSLAVLDGTSEITRTSALASGIVYENSADMIPAETIFWHKTQNNEAENQQENEISSENQTETEQKSEQEELAVQENTPENEVNYQIETSLEAQTDFQAENNEEIFQGESLSEEVQHEENQSVAIPSEEIQEQEILSQEEQQKEQIQEFQSQESNEEIKIQEQTQEMQNAEIPVETSETEKPEENTYNEINTSDNEENCSSSIPESSVIQEELSVIYGTEKKLEDIFESTGIKEEKFTSFRDIATAEEREYTKFDFELEAFPTKYLKQNICAGQVISFDGNLVIIGDCHEGSEISASGDITVWGDLSGSAYAGMNGNEKAKIRALRMNASQLRISTCFIKRPEALENPEMAKKPLIPEEASINKGEIGVYKIFK